MTERASKRVVTSRHDVRDRIRQNERHVRQRSHRTRTRDETIERRLYERFGVTAYCVIDPDLAAVRVYRRSGDCFDRPIELSCEAHDVLTTTVLPQLDLPLTRIFGN